MKSTTVQLDQKVIQDILVRTFEKSKQDSTLDTQDAVQDMVNQLKQAIAVSVDRG